MPNGPKGWAREERLLNFGIFVRSIGVGGFRLTLRSRFAVLAVCSAGVAEEVVVRGLLDVVVLESLNSLAIEQKVKIIKKCVSA